MKPATVAAGRGFASSGPLRYPPAMDDAALLAIAADLAREAGAIILASAPHDFATERKADASPSPRRITPPRR